MLNIVWNKNDDLTIFSCEEVEGLAEVRPAVSVSCFHLGFIALLKISYLYLYLSAANLFLLKLWNDKLLVQRFPPTLHRTSQQVRHPVRAHYVIVCSGFLPRELEFQNILIRGRYPGDLVGVGPNVDDFAVELRRCGVPSQLDVSFCLPKAVGRKAGVVRKILLPDPEQGGWWQKQSHLCTVRWCFRPSRLLL